MGPNKIRIGCFNPVKIKLTYYFDKVFQTLNETTSIDTINLHHEIEADTTVFADGKMLISIIQNIVSNAIKHKEKGGSIKISTNMKDDKIIVQVKDTGIGCQRR